MSRLVLRDAEVDGNVVDVIAEDGRLVDVGPGAGGTGGADDTIDAAGGALLPGLHDHHIHLLALAAALQSVAAGPPSITDRVQLGAALAAAAAERPPGAWVRAVGYHESVAGDLDRWALDAVVADRPVRVQHRSGALWILNSAAVEATGAQHAGLDGIERRPDGIATGRLWRLDSWLRDRLPAPDEDLDLDAVGELLLRRGVTGVTDATPFDDPAPLSLLARLPQRVVVTGGPSLPAETELPLARGPVKLLLPDHDAPALDRVIAGVQAARRQGRAVAVHCVTSVAAVLAVAAIEEVGPHPGDRIEHGAVVPLDLARRMAELGITVVTNPGFVAERGDQYLADVDDVDRPDLWRCRSLRDAGVAVAAGTDAPFGDADPWAAMAAAVDRRARSGRTVGDDRGVDPADALALFLGPLDRPGDRARRVVAGAPADLCLLAVPRAKALRDLAGIEVAATVVDGEPHRW